MFKDLIRGNRYKYIWSSSIRWGLLYNRENINMYTYCLFWLQWIHLYFTAHCMGFKFIFYNIIDFQPYVLFSYFTWMWLTVALKHLRRGREKNLRRIKRQVIMQGACNRMRMHLASHWPLRSASSCLVTTEQQLSYSNRSYTTLMKEKKPFHDWSESQSDYAASAFTVTQDILLTYVCKYQSSYVFKGLKRTYFGPLGVEFDGEHLFLSTV